MGKSCCNKDCEYEDNDLYIAWMKHTSQITKLHGKCCHDKCGCYDPKHCNLQYEYNYLNNKNQFLIPSN